MSQRIRSLTPKACPACGTVGQLSRVKNQLVCQQCGYSPSSPSALSPFTAPITSLGDDEVDPPQDSPIANHQPTSELKKIKPIPRPRAIPTADQARSQVAAPSGHQPAAPKKPTFKVPDTSPSPYSAERLEELKKIPVIEAITHPEPISSWVSAIYSTALQHARKQEWAEAAKSFRRTLEDERDFVDAHLWLARLSLTEKDMRDHLSTVLAIMPNHGEAMTRMMVLNGQMTDAEATRALNPHAAPKTQVASGPVAANAKLIKCPNCGGRMRAGDDGRSVVCEFCGHTEGRDMGTDSGVKSFSMAMLKQRGQPVRWIVGDRLLKCQTCGAERTLKQGAMSERCLFCGSSYVVQTDALGSFQQPDGMMRFAVNQQQAMEAVQQALKSGVERVKGWFVNNEAGRITLDTMYLPFWLFDFTLDVKKTITRKSGQRSQSQSMPAVRYETVTEMANDVPVMGSKEIDPRLINGAGRFMFDRIKPYHPDLLASHSAMIYHLPFDKAVLDARQSVAERMRMVYEQETSGGEEVRVSILFQQVMFRLVLLPFWVVTILEQDGDLRPALVNGQTGTVALGKARKPKG